MLYIAGNKGEEWFAVLNGREQKKYYWNTSDLDDGIGIRLPYTYSPIFSPDSKQFAYVMGESINEWFIVLNGQKLKKYYRIYEPIFSPDSKQFVYSANDGDESFVVLNGKEGKRYSAVSTFERKQLGAYLGDYSKYYGMVNSFVFSPDSRQFVYSANIGNKQIVVLNGQKENNFFDEVSQFVFSSDSQRFAYKALENGKYFVILDGKEGKKYEVIRNLIFSPDGTQFGYAAREYKTKWFVVINGQEKERFQVNGGIDSLVFDSTGNHFAYRVKAGSKWFVILDNQKSKSYDEIQNLTFSSDSKHLCYGARDGRDIWWVVEEMK